MAIDFPNIDPVAFWIGPLPIRWYALAYLAGFILGWRYCMALAGRDGAGRPHAGDVDDFLPWAIVGVILGGRLGYVLFYNPQFYMAYPLEALQIWQGGMAFHGGVIGVLISMVVFSRLRRFSFLRLSDLVCAAAPIGIFFGRIANFINGELYGRVSDVPWAIVFPRGGELARHPSQLYEAFLEGVLLFIILAIMARSQAVRNRPGVISGVFIAGYAVFRGFVEFYREPDAHIGLLWWDLSMGQILSAPMVLIGCLVIVYAIKRGSSKIQSS